MKHAILVTGLFDRRKTEERSIESCNRRLYALKEEQGKIFIDMSSLSYADDDDEGALEYLGKALETYQDMESIENQAMVIDLIADIYLNMREVNTALEFYQESFNLYKAARSPKSAEIMEKIGEVELIRESIEKADEYKRDEDESEEEKIPEIELPEELEIDYQALEDILDDAILILDESRVYQSYHQLEDPLTHIGQAYQMSKDIGDLKGEATLLLIMGDIYIGAENPDQAIHYFEDALKIFNKLDYDRGEAVARLMSGCTYLVLEDEENASYNMKIALDILHSLNDKKAEAVARKLIKNLYGSI
ncbi:MAG TPA: hypothetical protein VK444_07645 [Methanobacteriaceae archaeon]|nr:hypothetical protein [Methanobacteriaceae archaeon]